MPEEVHAARDLSVGPETLDAGLERTEAAEIDNDAPRR